VIIISDIIILCKIKRDIDVVSKQHIYPFKLLKTDYYFVIKSQIEFEKVTGSSMAMPSMSSACVYKILL
jgi:hypothetical protein